MDSTIDEFIKTNNSHFSNDESNYIYDDDDDSGYGNGYNSGYTDGFGKGSGSGEGSSYGNGYGDGLGDGNGNGNGYSNGYGCGYGYGNGYSNGYGNGDSNGCGNEYGNGDIVNNYSSYGIVSINNNKVYRIDNLPTIITSVKNNIAKGCILQNDLTLIPCFIVKEDNKFAHGLTLHKAFASLREKLYDDFSEEERIDKFKKHFSDFDKKYPVSELFIWHHILTGSCKAGRESFARDHEIDLQHDYMNIHEFIKITKDSYGGDIIKKL
jgi:hypothetical protein